MVTDNPFSKKRCRYLSPSSMFGVIQLSAPGSGGKALKVTIQKIKDSIPAFPPLIWTQWLSFMCADFFSPPSITFPLATESIWLRTSKSVADSSSLTGRVGRHRPIPRHPCHHCKTRRALGPQPFSIFELFLVGGCLLFWVALYLEQYSTITQKNAVSQVSRKQIEQEA